MDQPDPTVPYAPRMSASDAVMWDIEKDPVLRSTITAVALLDRTPDWDRLREIVDRATRVVPRLRERVVVPPLRIGLPRWVVDPQFDLDYHLRRVRVPAPGTLRQVLDLAQPLAMQGFDRARPLWEFTLVEGLEGGRAAFVQKLHHSMTDGVGGVELAMALLAETAAPDDGTTMPEPPPVGDVDPLGVLRASLLEMGRDAVSAGLRVPTGATRVALAAARAPIASVRNAAATGRSVLKGLTPVPASESDLLRERSLARHFDTIDVPLADLRAAGRAVGGSINDALLAAVVGGLTDYHRRRGAAVDELRLTMPVSFRTEADPLGGNRFAPVRFSVSTRIDDPAERMRVVGALARRWASEPFLDHADALAAGLDRLPTSLLTAAFGGMLKHTDVVVTDVPGIDTAVFLAGAEVLREYALAPLMGAAVNVSLFSLSGTACIGVVVDAVAVPDDELLMRCLVHAFDEVLAVPSHHTIRTA